MPSTALRLPTAPAWLAAIALTLPASSVGVLRADDNANIVAEAAPEAADDPRLALARSIEWTAGPGQGQLGPYASIEVPEGYVFTGPIGAQVFMELNENPRNPNTMGILQPIAEDQSWFVCFEYQDVGHVSDDDRQSIDAAALLTSIRQASDLGNEERRQRGWPEMRIKDWVIPPGYEPETKRLAWALGAEADAPDGSVQQICNYNVKLLGRTGVMSATLVCNPAEVSGLIPVVRSSLEGFKFLPGHAYGEWREGDKLAAYGLTGLITGGAAVVAAKSGLLGKLLAMIAKGGKLVIVAVAALFAGIWKLFFGRKSATAPE